MKWFPSMLFKPLANMVVVAFLSLVSGDVVYSQSDFMPDRTGYDPKVMPKWLKSDQDKGDSLMKQRNAVEIDQKVFYIDKQVDKRLTKDEREEVKPYLKKKTGATEGSGAPASIAENKPPEPAGKAIINAETVSDVITDAVDRGGRVLNLDNGNLVTTWREGTDTFFSIHTGDGNTILEREKFGLAGNWDYTYVYDSNLFDAGNGQFGVVIYGSRSEYREGDYYKSDSVYAARIYDTKTEGGNTGRVVTERKYMSHYHYNYKNGHYSYKGTSLSNLTSLGNDRYAMLVTKYDYKHNASGTTYSYDYLISVTDNSLDLNTAQNYKLDNYQTGNWENGDYSYKSQYATSILSLGDDSFVATISEYAYDQRSNTSRSGTYLKVMDKDLSQRSEKYFENTYQYEPDTYYKYRGSYQTHTASLGNGEFASAWTDYDSYYDYRTGESNYRQDITITKFDKDLNEVESFVIPDSYRWHYDSAGYTGEYKYVTDMKALEGGELIVGLSAYRYSYDNATGSYESASNTYLNIVTSTGEVSQISLAETSSDSSAGNYVYVNQIIPLEGGNFALSINEYEYTGGVYTQDFEAQQFSITYEAPTISPGIGPSGDSTTSRETYIYELPSYEKLAAEISSEDKIDDETREIFIESLQGEGIYANTTQESPFGDYIMSGEAKTALEKILANPTPKEKENINTIETILALLKTAEQNSANPEETNNLEEELARNAALSLVANAENGLLSERERTAISVLFRDLKEKMKSLFRQYDDNLEAYYRGLKEELADNMTILQLKGILSNRLTSDNLMAYNHMKIVNVIKSIREKEDKTITPRLVLRKESALFAAYVEPANKILLDGVQEVALEFNRRLRAIIYGEGTPLSR